MADRQYIVKNDEDLFSLLVADIYECAGRLRRSGEAIASWEGQTQARWQLLSVVSDRPLTVPQAARRLGLSRQAVQRVANDVVDEALVEVQENPDHKGSPLFSLTPGGRAVLARITKAARMSHRQLAASVPRADIETTRRTLAAFVEQLSGQEWRADTP
jgi:DNA-binding MarR family transcriptional regulator